MYSTLQNVCYLFAGILNYVRRVYNVFVKKLILYIKEKKACPILRTFITLAVPVNSGWYSNLFDLWYYFKSLLSWVVYKI